MPRDSELDQLKDEQDLAFQRKQDAWQAQDDAWEQRQAAQEEMNQAHAQQQAAYEDQDDAWQSRQSARDVMDQAYDVKQRAHEEQQDAWDELQRIRDRNGPRIDYLNGEQEAAYQNMRDAFDNASAAHESRDGASARSYADDGHRYKEESRGYVEERRELIAEIRQAKAEWEETRSPFQSAKADFDSARSAFNEAKAHHERKRSEFQSAKAEFEQARSEFTEAKANHAHARDEFKQAKAEFERAKSAFQVRLDQVRNEQQQRKDDKRSLAERAGVPSQYLDDVWVSTEPDGTVNIYFGGTGEPAGPGHGHYAMDSYGNVTYARDPDEDHGAHNFTDYQERVAAPPRAQGSNWYTKSDDRDETIHLMVDKEGNSTTDYPHVHVIHDERHDQIRVVASYGPGDHSETTTLSGDASGNDVNEAVDEMRRRL